MSAYQNYWKHCIHSSLDSLLPSCWESSCWLCRCFASYHDWKNCSQLQERRGIYKNNNRLPCFCIWNYYRSLFLTVNFQVGIWRVNYTNACGIFLSGLFLLSIVGTLFGVSDLSKEFDYKEFLKNNEEGCSLREEGETLNETSVLDERSPLISSDSGTRSSTNIIPTSTRTSQFGYCTIIPKLLCDIDKGLVMLLTFFCSFVIVVYDTWPSVIMIDVLDWSIAEVYAFTGYVGICTLLLLVILSKFPVSGRTSVYLAIAALLMAAVIALLAIVLCQRVKNYAVNIILWCIYGILLAITDLVETVFLCVIFSQMVPSSVQSFAEGIRKLFANVGAIVGILISGSLFFAITYICIGLICVFLICAGMLFIRRYKFMTPEYDEIIL